MDGENMPINNLLEQTACFVRRCKKTAGEIEQTEGYKRRQIKKLIKKDSAGFLLPAES
ncbi:hypothetical protein [Bacteroides caecicola]|uniref:hypothetical protein n=1 Tax=Bacteroides caecicola TaxID=1462569 RepID=UPI002012EEC2|nr:hypothetical protein [Bacteroides caecicola]MCL1625431.1 hypothetical protein [Bacteroides caecicola]